MVVKHRSLHNGHNLRFVSTKSMIPGGPPPWRCEECVKKDQYAVQRILEVVRGEDGKFYLLLEYLGYRYLEARLESRLVDRNSELRRAYREHANTRTSISMLYFAGAILDAMWHGQSLKELGMDKNWCTGTKRRDCTSSAILRCKNGDSHQVWHRLFKCWLHKNMDLLFRSH
jgi:hypothetical protein